MKKIFASVMSVILALSLTACAGTPGGTSSTSGEGAFGTEGTKELAAAGTVSTPASEIELTGDVSAIKIGAIMLGDENEGYTYAHIDGIKRAAANLGIADSQIIWKYNTPEDQTCKDAADDLVNQGCDIIISNSYGHQDFMLAAAKEYSDVIFVAMTGDTAASSGLDNFCNAFTGVYESRYVSGVAAGMKIKELVESGTLTKETQPDSFDADGNVKIGYVGAYPYAEVVSGYTAFFLGIKSVYENVSMTVSYTNEWFSITKEGAAAEQLMASGCVIIGQHADSTGAPAAVQEAHDNGKLAFSVGYNISMLEVAPDVAITSATNNWAAYYEYAFKTVINGDTPATNWCAGYADDAVAVTELGSAAAAGTQEKIDEVEAAIKAGTLHVFDTDTFTVGGKKVTWAYATDTNGDFTYDANNVIADGYYHESHVQSAPSFTLRIDGITELS